MEFDLVLQNGVVNRFVDVEAYPDSERVTDFSKFSCHEERNVVSGKE